MYTTKFVLIKFFGGTVFGFLTVLIAGIIVVLVILKEENIKIRDIWKMIKKKSKEKNNKYGHKY